MRLAILSDQLTVSLGGPLPRQLADGARAPRGGGAFAPFGAPLMRAGATFGISRRFQRFSPPQRQVAHVFLALPPLSPLNIAILRIPFDLHA